MSYDIIKSISVREGKVYVTAASNNVTPKYFEEWCSPSLSKILQEEGREALDLVILREYESGNFQRGNNRYTRALKVLHYMPEYQEFNWRSDKPWEEREKLRSSEEFTELLKKAMKTQLPKEKYVIRGNIFTAYWREPKTLYLKRKSSRKAGWVDLEKATVFRYREEAENYKRCFAGSEDWEVVLLKNTKKEKSMKLMTKEIEEKAQAQYAKGSELDDQLVVAKFFDPTGSWTWYLMNQDPEDPDYLWGIVNGFEIEMGSFSLSELQSVKGKLGLGIERDIHWSPMPAKEVWERLNKREHL